MDNDVAEKDTLIQILIAQRNSMMDQITGLQLQLAKAQPKEPVPNDDKPQQ